MLGPINFGLLMLLSCLFSRVILTNSSEGPNVDDDDDDDDGNDDDNDND